MSNQPFRLRALENLSKNLFGWIAARLLSGTPPADSHVTLRSVLALRQDHLGDFILTVPALRALKRRMAPGGRLTLVASAANAEFARLLFPEENVLVYGRTPFSRLRLFARLARDRYDVVVDFHSTFSTTSTLLILLAGAPLRAGYWTDGKHRDLSRVVFNLGLAPPPDNLHESRRSLRVVQRLQKGKDPLPRVYAVPDAPPDLARRVDAFFRQCGVGPRTKVLGIHPTLRKGSNCWAPENYLKLLRLLSGDRRLKTVVIHGRGEAEPLGLFLAAAEKEGLEIQPLPGNDVATILEAARHIHVAVAGDSGLAHLLSLRTEVIEIFGPSNPVQWAPLGPHRVLRTPDRLCDSVEPRRVAALVKASFLRK